MRSRIFPTLAAGVVVAVATLGVPLGFGVFLRWVERQLGLGAWVLFCAACLAAMFYAARLWDRRDARRKQDRAPSGGSAAGHGAYPVPTSSFDDCSSGTDIGGSCGDIGGTV